MLMHNYNYTNNKNNDMHNYNYTNTNAENIQGLSNALADVIG